MKRLSCKILLLLTALLLALSAVSVCSAAGVAQFSMSTVRFDNATGKYVPATAFDVGETVTLAVSITGIEDQFVRGNALTVTFDNTALHFLDKSTVVAVADENAIFSAKARDNRVIVTWDTNSNDTVFNGTVYYLRFEALDGLTSDANVQFTLQVDELFASANGFPYIPFTIAQNSVSASIVLQDIDNAALALFNKLETVTVDSLQDITDAMDAYNALTTAQKKYLQSAYPEQFQWLSTAYERYYAAVEAATAQEVQSIIDDFKKTFGELLNRPLAQVTLQDADAVDHLATTYEALPGTVTSRLGKDVEAKVEELEEWILTLTDAQADAEFFRENYAQYYNMTDTEINIGYENYYTYVDEAMMIYDSYDDATKLLLTEEYKKLSAVAEKMNALLAADEKESALREKVAAFQQKWLRCFTLNSANVSIGDKTALEMCIADFNKLEADVKERLQARISSFENLLTVIAAMEEESNNTATPEPGVIEVPGPTQIQTVIQKEPVVKTETETVTKTVTKLVGRQGFTKSIYILLGLLGLTLLLALLPLILQLRYNKLARLAAGEAAADEDCDIYSHTKTEKGENDD